MATYKPLSTDFKDDILASQNSKRKYTQVNNSDGTVSFQDSTAYSQVGSSYGAKEVNEERKAINNVYANKLVTLDEINLVTEPGFFVDAKAVKELNSNKKVECFSKTVATDTNLLVDFSSEVNQIIKNGGKIVSAIPGATTNSNNALVYGKVAIQALPDWSEVYVRCNSNYYSGLGGTTTLNLLVIYV